MESRRAVSVFSVSSAVMYFGRVGVKRRRVAVMVIEAHGKINGDEYRGEISRHRRLGYDAA